MATNVEFSPYFAARARTHEVVLRDIPRFDLESYIANYEGFTRLVRLNHIARLSPPLALECLRIAIPEAKAGKNPEAYFRLATLLHGIDPGSPLATVDTTWIERRKVDNQKMIEKLETELRGYKNMLISESIRMGQADLGNHYVSTADFENAQKAYQKMRDVCVHASHIAEMVLKLMYASIEAGQWMGVLSQCQRAETMSLDAQTSSKVRQIVKACSGLVYMATERYDLAVRCFRDVDIAFATNGPVGGIDFAKSVVTANDIAIYGGLCALATRDREFLQTHILSQTSGFRELLVLEPHMRRAIMNFCDGKYTQCLAVLEAYRTDFMLDVYLCPHVDRLFQMIRSRCITQYLLPFSQVSLSALETAFPRSQPPADNNTTEDELVDMIRLGLLNARIDAVNHTVVIPRRDSKLKAHQETMQLAESAERALRLRLHTISLYEAGLELRDPQKQSIKRPGMAFT